MGLAEEILAADDQGRRKVEVPEWGALGEDLYVRVLSARARDAWEADIVARQQKGDAAFKDNFRARLVALALVDANGRPVFTLEQAEELGEKSSAAVGRLFAAARELNGLSAEAVEAAEKK